MLLDLFPERLAREIARLDLGAIQELRLRRNSRLTVLCRGIKQYVMRGAEPVMVSGSDIEYVLKRATENSLYAYSSQIRQGFITAAGGVRLGLAGESVNADNFMPTTIKNIHAINIRIPHEEKNCSAIAFKFIAGDWGIKSTLIISPPGAGKTTFLRDICRKLSDHGSMPNCLLVDERFEMASCRDGEPMLDVGQNTDIVSGATKEFAFANGIRALRPDVIITDELATECDARACQRAMRSGVKVIASVHAASHIELFDRPEFEGLVSGKYFERFVVLSNKNGPGTIEGIYDENLKCIYF